MFRISGLDVPRGAAKSLIYKDNKNTLKVHFSLDISDIVVYNPLYDNKQQSSRKIMNTITVYTMTDDPSIDIPAKMGLTVRDPEIRAKEIRAYVRAKYSFNTQAEAEEVEKMAQGLARKKGKWQPREKLRNNGWTEWFNITVRQAMAYIMNAINLLRKKCKNSIRLFRRYRKAFCLSFFNSNNPCGWRQAEDYDVSQDRNEEYPYHWTWKGSEQSMLDWMKEPN